MKSLLWICCLMIATALHASTEKVVLITGATGGIGMPTIEAFENKGWKVWAGYRSKIPDEAKKFSKVKWVQLDVTSDAQVEHAIEQLIKEEGKIDVLVNNAGYGIIGAEECVKLDEAKQLFEVNFFGAFRLIQAVAPYMRQKTSGHIINISSMSGVRAPPGLGLYAASKFALEGLSESLAVTLSPWNIQVSLVEPTNVKNDWGVNCIVGSRQCEEAFYTDLATSFQKKLNEWSQTAQSSEEIAALIVDIAENPHPDMRYQTSPKAKDTAARRFVDTTGNAMRCEMLHFLKTVIEK